MLLSLALGGGQTSIPLGAAFPGVDTPACPEWGFNGFNWIWHLDDVLALDEAAATPAVFSAALMSTKTIDFYFEK